MSITKQVRPFHTLLVANRGEIAIRVMRTARRMGYRTVAVYSDADRDSPHSSFADCAVHIGGAAPRESYLNIDALLEAARQSGADAIHPGYGFLAENEDFADAVDEAGLVFVGPSGMAIREMGNKARAKDLMRAADTPCIPGYQGRDQSLAALARAAAQIGYPVMVKAAAGGGGRGMRLVGDEASLEQALNSARAEAASAFGSDELILERAVIAPRHIEIQVLADSYGNVIHLGERDCSVQRRHQKVIEEAPSPAVDAALRERMGDAAVRSARAIGYVGVGTLEFLLDRDGRFYFMEMNTRLQVEHAVTEAVAGIDLVEWQLRVAAGERLTLQQEDLRLSGHAIEVRLTAEDVPAGFLPQTGPVLRWQPPAPECGVRVDHGLAEGGAVSAHYDSMVAKLIAHGATRDEARRKLRHAVQQCVLLGLPTNQGFLADCLADPVFAEGSAVHTGFVAERFGAHPAARALPDGRTLAYAAFAAIALRTPQPHDTLSIAPAPLGKAASSVVLGSGAARWQATLSAAGRDWRVSLRSECPEVSNGLDDESNQFIMRGAQWAEADRARLTVECDGMRETVTVATQSDTLYVFHAGEAWTFEQISARKSRLDEEGGGSVTAPMTGRILELAVREGDRVEAGQRLLALEAMKMEYTLVAPIGGTVAEVWAQAGGQADKGALLIRIEAAA
ncbi:MAG TPA: biotin carboxylase N-terminal domain-containing protein [Paraburkholderia sp.]|uniref:acetyl/propionyl/methylcrotonyl-CoA carboxylase subunit alpha n=1 Tax=Paraburkholderia sp. TaxID=1926495 RepID=UPI002B8216FB|nr:biotin carboxylase N-terminal domain-containing protein [Paraburkholderia sp.]HTR09710.1 biotin carboxylase N-terminal domain-containing protein [Paraburkholderia sp.]